MFEWKPVFAPELETGAAEPADAAQPEAVEADVPEQRDDGPGSGRSALRKDLEAGFERARKATEEPVRRERKKSDRVGGRLAEMPDSGPAEAAEAAPAEETELPASAPPEGWTKEAKALWENLDPVVQAAALKRESDMNRGVKALQSKYDEIDRALEPHLQNIAAYGHTPGAAVNQLFAWFDALGKNPQIAFPALARSFGYDISQFVRAPNQPQQRPQQQQQPQQGQATQQQKPNGQQAPVDPRFINWTNEQFQAVRKAFDPLQAQVVQLQAQLQANNQAKTEENLSYWAKDKPYYEECRERMAHLLQSGAVPLKNGTVDLDAAYEAALWSVPDVRNRMLLEQQTAARAAAKTKKEADLKVQAAQAEKARRAATSLPLNAPGAPAVGKPGAVKRGKTVRDSINEAIESVGQ